MLTITASAQSTYTVKSGDTLWKIASKHQVGLSELIAANPQIKNISLIYPG
ncbi:MAG: LysM peptidoglycan-binding domain-containing protein, partial [[Clostridium] cellulosi]